MATSSGNSRVNYWAIVPAAGLGTRMRAEIPKQYLPLAGRTVLEHSLHRLAMHPSIAKIIVAIAENDTHWQKIRLDFVAKPVQKVTGGAERCHSVLAAMEHLNQMAADDDWVLVHDAARPCLRPGDLDKIITELKTSPVGGILAVPVKDTMKRSNEDMSITETVDRSNLWHALTPQMFRFGLLRDALREAINNNSMVTDEAAAMEFAGHKALLLEAHPDNIKITTPEDLTLAEFYLSQQQLQGIGVVDNSLEDGG